MIFADKIIRLRKKNGWSQEDLAEKMNVSRQSVSKWEGAQSVPDLEKVLMLADLFGVTTDYLLRDSIENEEYTDGTSEPTMKKLTLAQANEYLDLRKKAAKNIATATMLCILSVIPLLVLGAASELPSFIWSEDLACGIGLVAMFVIVALAVVIFVRTGLESSPYEFIVKEPFENEYGVVGFVKDAQSKFKSTYDKYKWVGSAVCILSPIPLFCGAFTGNDFLTVIMLAVTMVTAGIGATLFIFAEVRWASMQKILKTEDYSPEEKKKNSIKEPVATVYWLLATAVYLIWSFVTYDWQKTWLVWPIAGVLFAAVMAVCKLILNSKENKG